MTRRLLALLLSLSAGCANDMREMMDNMGGDSADRGRPIEQDAAAPDAMPPDMLPLEPGPALTLHHLRLRGTFQSYHLNMDPPSPTNDFEHPPFPAQLGTLGMRSFHFNANYNTSGALEVFNHSLIDFRSRCPASIFACFQPMGEWSQANPRHAPIVVVIDDPFLNEVSGLHGVLDVLHVAILRAFDREQVFTMDDLRRFQPGLTVREIVTQNLWPPLDAMRGKFIFLLAEPAARQNQRELSWGLDREPELLLWLYADGTDDDELAADDAAIALLPPIEDAAAAERAAEVVDRGYLTWTLADDAETYARAADAGVHIIVSRSPDALFPPPGDPEWPVSCNPRTAPEGCRPRQIENRRVPE